MAGMHRLIRHQSSGTTCISLGMIPTASMGVLHQTLDICLLLPLGAILSVMMVLALSSEAVELLTTTCLWPTRIRSSSALLPPLVAPSRTTSFSRPIPVWAPVGVRQLCQL